MPAENALPNVFLPRLPVVQVAGVVDVAEARLLDHLGVDLIGFPLRLDVHAPDLSEMQAAEVIRAADIAGKSVCITYESDPAQVVTLCRGLGVRLVQLHGPVQAEAGRRIKEIDQGLGIMKSVVVGRDGDMARLNALLSAYAPFVDAFITDTFDPATGASGATGRTHDWAVSRALTEAAEALDRPLMLAGGLNAENVADAIRAVRPWGVDAHTGLEDGSGRKDPDKVRRFVEEAHAAFSVLADDSEA
ncbi:phosphoribosylanthranilate isomerase [Desulfocurvibacter africanus]|uniref:N-(5'-phosphoribosyl)anthranilate isomerase n=1 Tax=Desulfocurvibacter africanus subsp. africanus str. Walvis Bay TaxID=690850 RepID=F3Z0L2_DESAF|nr:phosphoribosylanthranilate isomerase [Desulfocurvibacter africanus]EGJ49836.1 Phosphoribosylanthranilate isomerase [Desulfocurvibacter africanus subsp. africanus str. Walvis Bay]